MPAGMLIRNEFDKGACYPGWGGSTVWPGHVVGNKVQHPSRHRSQKMPENLAHVAGVALGVHAVAVVARVVAVAEQSQTLFDAPPSHFQTTGPGRQHLVGSVSVSDPVMERIGGRHDHGVPCDVLEFLDAGHGLGVPPGQIRVARDELGTADPAACCLFVPEKEEVQKGELVRPVRSPAQGRALDSPRVFDRGVAPVRHPHASLLEFVGERVQHTEHQHLVRAAVQARVHGGRCVVSAHLERDVREDYCSATLEDRSEAPRVARVEQPRGTVGPQASLRKLSRGPEIGEFTVHSGDSTESVRRRISLPSHRSGRSWSRVSR